THNPFFYINSPLVSRSQVFQLEPLKPEDLITLMKRALADPERGLGKYNVEITEDALRHLAVTADGDARKCLNALEIGVLTTPPSLAPLRMSVGESESRESSLAPALSRSLTPLRKSVSK